MMDYIDSELNRIRQQLPLYEKTLGQPMPLDPQNQLRYKQRMSEYRDLQSRMSDLMKEKRTQELHDFDRQTKQTTLDSMKAKFADEQAARRLPGSYAPQAVRRGNISAGTFTGSGGTQQVPVFGTADILRNQQAKGDKTPFQLYDDKGFNPNSIEGLKNIIGNVNGVDVNPMAEESKKNIIGELSGYMDALNKQKLAETQANAKVESARAGKRDPKFPDWVFGRKVAKQEKVPVHYVDDQGNIVNGGTETKIVYEWEDYQPEQQYKNLILAGATADEATQRTGYSPSAKSSGDGWFPGSSPKIPAPNGGTMTGSNGKKQMVPKAGAKFKYTRKVIEADSRWAGWTPEQKKVWLKKASAAEPGNPDLIAMLKENGG